MAPKERPPGRSRSEIIETVRGGRSGPDDRAVAAATRSLTSTIITSAAGQRDLVAGLSSLTIAVKSFVDKIAPIGLELQLQKDIML